MRYFNNLSESQLQQLFYKVPSIVTKETEKTLLAHGVGALLYMPATRKDIADVVITNKYKELVTIVICLEDSIGDSEVELAENLLIKHLKAIHEVVRSGILQKQSLPLIFIRVRTPRQMTDIVNSLGEAISILVGFVFPKFSSENAEGYLKSLKDLNNNKNTLLYGMPILESPKVLYKEGRLNELLLIKKIVDIYASYVLNIRIGATDLCGLYGLRRDSETTVYEISIINELITDIVNIFSREPEGYVVSGPVWEHFTSTDRILKPQLRQTLFEQQSGSQGILLRKELIRKDFDGLIQETLLDKANGLVGKTIIHPTHLLPVQSLHVVTKEEYVDALGIIEQAPEGKGVFKSEFQNKMNEIKPHLNWAKKVLVKSEIYGVYNESSTFIQLLSEMDRK